MLSNVDRASGRAVIVVRPSIEAHIAWVRRELDDLEPGTAADPPPESRMAG